MLEKASYIPVVPQKSPNKVKFIMSIITTFILTFTLAIKIVSVYSNMQPPVEAKPTLSSDDNIIRMMLDVTHFSKNENGVEIPFKLVSITPMKNRKSFFASILIKIPKDLIDNELLVRNVLYGLEYNFVDAIKRATDEKKSIYADLKHGKKKYEEIILAIYMIEFVDGELTNEDFLTLFKTSFLDYIDDYYKLINHYRRHDVYEVSTLKNFAYTIESESDENDEKHRNIAED